MRVLTTRPAPAWRQIPVAMLLLAAQIAVGLIVLALRTSRAVLTLTVAVTGRLEYLLAARTGRPVLSDTGIAALAVVFVTEARAGWSGTGTPTH